MKTPSALITGGNGFIGKSISETLIDNGYNVTVIGRSARSLKDVNYIRADLTFPLQLHQRFDLWIHAAADLNSNQPAFQSNIIYCRHTLEAALLSTPAKFLYISSIPVIGIPLSLPIDENHPVRPITEYHLSKYCCELLCFLPRYSELRPSVLRVASPIGPGLKDGRFLPSLLKACRERKPMTILGRGKRIQNYIDTSDLARAVILAALKPEAEGLFLIPGHSVSNLRLAEICRETVGYSSEIRFDGIDGEEDRQWLVSGSLADNVLGYKPQISLEDSIKHIWNSD